MTPLKQFASYLLAVALIFAPCQLPSARAADITVTASSVVKGTRATTATGIALSTITAGQPLYVDPATGSLAPAKADTVVHAACVGISLNGGAVGQPIIYQTSGPITIGATVVQGATYCVSSANAGGIAPNADITTGAYVTIIGVASTTGVITINLNVTGIVHG